ncbi:hypothetical protein BCT30_23455 [Enterovibrio norvegicus]|uniref:hypothetical protein n=1 Tax=Enterovibrio norvegicus TaxID=188144 RepID=UPI00030C076D|nr:hypothetical protein [Enterovibrio norvegicus]MCC4796685.1 hypothetical protein [Enterovibrio norvegicus]OEE49560.1 hypothetical protein A1OS_07235 [Enterovibrio norvegicus]PMH70318.1 hypothetical protein BCU62_25170 [Enterovibrio norvegicus]PMI35801.1 hypothetical protein BCU46_16255 [Enterovibrio norvegicus]PMN45325.1 hypothetical protein BCT30_23455 [Enterovibrio norvegicus]
MATQKTKVSTHESMTHKYGDDVEHKHDKDHLEYREHEPSHGHHLHGGVNSHKGTHHHHRTTHHHHHYYGPVTIVMGSDEEDDA